jgi:hypothetical protein
VCLDGNLNRAREQALLSAPHAQAAGYNGKLGAEHEGDEDSDVQATCRSQRGAARSCFTFVPSGAHLHMTHVIPDTRHCNRMPLSIPAKGIASFLYCVSRSKAERELAYVPPTVQALSTELCFGRVEVKLSPQRRGSLYGCQPHPPAALYEALRIKCRSSLCHLIESEVFRQGLV